MKAPNTNFSFLVEMQLESFKSISKAEKDFIGDILYSNSDIINILWNKTEIDNFRILNKVIYAFISCCEQFQLYNDKEFDENLLYSLILAFISYEKDFYKEVFYIKTGENPIYYFVKKYYSNNTCDDHPVLNIFDHYKNKHKFRWLGSSLSFKWVFGIHEEINIDEVIVKVNQYNNTFSDIYLSSPEVAEPVEFEDAILYISNKSPSRIKKVKELLIANKISINNIQDFNRFAYDNVYELIFHKLDHYNIHKLLTEDDELKILIFKLIPENAISKRISEVEYTESYDLYTKYIKAQK
jgi:hypothetical protein